MNSNQMTTGRSTALAIGGSDPYSSYGAKIDQADGTYLSFKGGEFLFGKNGEELPLGTCLVANMSGLRVGFKRWQNGRVTDDVMDRLTDGRMPMRSGLGDNDQSLWERDDRGQLRDPWVFTNELQLRHDNGEVFIFSTSSKGGLSAIGKLCKEYSKLYRTKPGKLPLVAINADFYMHREYGKTYYPVFIIADWVEDPGAGEVLTVREELDDQIPF